MSAPDSEVPYADVVAADARRTKAMIDRDIATLQSLIGKDCRYVHSSAAVDTKAGYLDKLARAVFGYTWISTSDQQVIDLGSAVVISHRMDAEVVLDGVARPYSSQAAAVWRRGNGGPELVFFQATTIPDPQAGR